MPVKCLNGDQLAGTPNPRAKSRLYLYWPYRCHVIFTTRSTQSMISEWIGMILLSNSSWRPTDQSEDNELTLFSSYTLILAGGRFLLKLSAMSNFCWLLIVNNLLVLTVDQKVISSILLLIKPTVGTKRGCCIMSLWQRIFCMSSYSMRTIHRGI